MKIKFNYICIIYLKSYHRIAKISFKRTMRYAYVYAEVIKPEANYPESKL